MAYIFQKHVFLVSFVAAITPQNEDTPGSKPELMSFAHHISASPSHDAEHASAAEKARHFLLLAENSNGTGQGDMEHDLKMPQMAQSLMQDLKQDKKVFNELTRNPAFDHNSLRMLEKNYNDATYIVDLTSRMRKMLGSLVQTGAEEASKQSKMLGSLVQTGAQEASSLSESVKAGIQSKLHEMKITNEEQASKKSRNEEQAGKKSRKFLIQGKYNRHSSDDFSPTMVVVVAFSVLITIVFLIFALKEKGPQENGFYQNFLKRTSFQWETSSSDFSSSGTYSEDDSKTGKDLHNRMKRFEARLEEHKRRMSADNEIKGRRDSDDVHLSVKHLAATGVHHR